MVSASALQPSSASGTNNGHAACKTVAQSDDAWRIASTYALLETVASVAITPILGVLSWDVSATALRPPGPMTPTTSMPVRSRIFGRASADAVLHATTS